MKVKRTEIVGAYSVVVEAEFDTTIANDSEYADKLFTVKRSRDLDLEEVKCGIMSVDAYCAKWHMEKADFPNIGEITDDSGAEVE